MRHRLICAVEDALGWCGPTPLGGRFERGTVSDPGLLERLLTPARLLDLVMRRSLGNPQLRCFSGGSELHPGAYFSQVTSQRGQTVQTVNMRRLGALLTDGATLVLDQANAFDPILEVVCRGFQWWSRERVQANIYLTTGDASGFDLHWDDHDVLIVQLAGQKRWEIRGPSRTAPMYRDTDRNQTPSEGILWSGLIQAGDVVHIPRGYWHQATRAGLGMGHSMHVTFGFTKRTGAHWLSWLADWSRDNEVFRRDLDRWGQEAEHGSQARQLAEAAAELVRSRGPEMFLTDLEREVPPARHIPYLETFGPLDAVVCVTEFPPTILEGDDAVEILACGKKITFAGKTSPALRLLLSGHPVRLSEAAATVGSTIERVAEVLVKEELCACLTPELSSGYTGLVTNVGC